MHVLLSVIAFVSCSLPQQLPWLSHVVLDPPRGFTTLVLYRVGFSSDQSAEGGADRSGVGQPEHRYRADQSGNGRQDLLLAGLLLLFAL